MLGRLLENRAGSFQQLWGSAAIFDRGTASGISITQDKSLEISTIYASVRLISDTISTLPVDQFIREDGARRPYRPREEWVQRPNMMMDRTTFWQQVIVSLLLDGNAFIHILRDEQGGILELHVLNPNDVEVMSGRRYRILHSNMTLDREEILHITELLLPGHLRGVSRIDKAKESLGLSQALTEFSARFFGNGAYAGGVIEYPGELSPEQQQMLRDSWDGAHRGVHRSHRPAVLFGGAKYTPTMVNPSDSQLLDERKFAVQEIARIFRVPLFMLSVSEPGAVSYASVEQQMQWFVSTTIQTYAQKLETAFSQLLTRRDSFIKFNLNSLVRADLQTRTAAYSSALSAGWMSVNDVRGLEDLRPVEDGDQYRVPLQNVPLTDAPVITIAEKAKAAQALTTAGFTGDSIARLLELPLDHTGQASVQVQPMPEAGA